MSGPRPRAAQATGAGFSLPAAAAAGAGPATTGAAASLDGMLALQETTEQPGCDDLPPARDRRARRRGRDLLDALAALQRGVLGRALGGAPGGAAEMDALRRLAALAAVAPDAADPALGRILAEIRMRAHVELARYDPV